MKQICFFMGGAITLWAYKSYGVPGVLMLGLSDIGLYFVEKFWGE